MDKRRALLILLITVVTCIIYSAFVLSMIHFKNEPVENRVNLTGVNCSSSAYLGRKLFFHICLKEKKIVYDIRYFWENKDKILKADIIGVQLNQAEFKKNCKYCPS